jgi:hypothetical protein
MVARVSIVDILTGNVPGARFNLGQVVSTPAAIDALVDNEVTAIPYLLRHVMGDWGDMSEEDKAENDYAIGRELRIFSAYTLPDGETKIWIVTESDRSATTILRPSDY